MTNYAVVWHPYTDNLGDDLLTLAASRLLPKVDRVLNADHLDEALPDLEPDDRIVALLCGNVMRHPVHWPPERHIAPVMVGAHFSHEDIWGLPFAELDGAGLKYLSACAPVGCRDQRTMKLMESRGIPCQLTACLTLTLERPDVPAPAKPYMVVCDVPEEIRHDLEGCVGGLEVRATTHTISAECTDYQQRMNRASEQLKLYAGAQCVVTRRLHCAMACLAIGTPVMLVYHSEYEDVTRFAPMDGMLPVSTMTELRAQLRSGSFVPHWKNPSAVNRWQGILKQAVAEGIARAETLPLPILQPEEALTWRRERMNRTAASAARKIHRLEQEHYESLHEKFSFIIREDTAKSALTTLLEEPEIRRALHKAALRRCLSLEPWYKRPFLRLKIRLGQVQPEDLHKLALDILAPLGWPEGQN